MTDLARKPSVRIERVEFASGLRTVNGQPHGLNWRRAYAVVVRFLDREAADEFAAMAREWPPRSVTENTAEHNPA